MLDPIIKYILMIIWTNYNKTSKSLTHLRILDLHEWWNYPSSTKEWMCKSAWQASKQNKERWTSKNDGSFMFLSLILLWLLYLLTKNRNTNRLRIISIRSKHFIWKLINSCLVRLGKIFYYIPCAYSKEPSFKRLTLGLRAISGESVLNLL